MEIRQERDWRVKKLAKKLKDMLYRSETASIRFRGGELFVDGGKKKKKRGLILPSEAELTEKKMVYVCCVAVAHS